jgi:hypothetical protein
MYDQETGIFELETDKPLILLIGSIGHEGILSTLRAAGRQYKNKFLESRVKNWESILQYFEDYTIDCVLVKLSPQAISLTTSAEYDSIREKMFRSIGSVPNIVFVYEDILSGHYEEGDWADIYHRPSEEARNAVFEMLAGYDIRLMPYKRNAEVTVMAETFLVETEQNLVFRLYVPSGRLWSNESDKLLQLFRDYLARVAHISVRLDQYRTDKGIIYEIHSEEITSPSGINDEFAEFTSFMDLCATDLQAAEKTLKSKDVKQRDVIGILSRYSKEAKRLSVDLKHEREQKVLSIRHRLESELVDTIPGAADWDSINSLVNMAVPPLSGSRGAISVDQGPMRLPAQTTAQHLTINLNPQIIDTVNGVIAQEISGDQHVGIEAQQLLELIQQYGGNASRELASSVHELEDQSAPKGGRLNAKQRLTKFLIGVGKSVEGVATNVLQSYIQSKLGL